MSKRKQSEDGGDGDDGQDTTSVKPPPEALRGLHDPSAHSANYVAYSEEISAVPSQRTMTR